MIPWVHEALHYLLIGVLAGSAAYIVVNLSNGRKWKDRRVRIGAVVFFVALIAYVLLAIFT